MCCELACCDASDENGPDLPPVGVDEPVPPPLCARLSGRGGPPLAAEELFAEFEGGGSGKPAARDRSYSETNTVMHGRFSSDPSDPPDGSDEEGEFVDSSKFIL